MRRTSNFSVRARSLAIVLLAFVAATWASPVLAQLQGGSVYPIDGVQNPPVSFQSIGTAVTYMVANGVTGSGQVVLELNSGYAGETSSVTIPPITGTNAALGVTFRPASGYSAQTITAGAASPNQFAVRITGSYITLDGQAGGGGGGRNWLIRCTGPGSSG
ncbi:MAG: hypothetical protein FJY75_11180, partial [Candidatus Eisenbacteria bacterium]|nr:hypothetical protein [Candidatus Eisenbacteria bacterium]